MYNKRQISCQNFIKVLEGKEGKKLPNLGFQCLDHPPYSPDLALSDYHLSPGLEKQFERSPFFIRRGGHCCHGDLVGRTTF